MTLSDNTVAMEKQEIDKEQLDKEKRVAHKEKIARKRKAAAENPIYLEIKRRELAEGKKSKSSNRKEDDFREVDDMHTAVYYFENELRKVKPYYFEYKSFAKGRWLDRTLLEVFASEFRDRNEDYYRYAIERGLLTINDKPVTLDTIVKTSDVIGHKIHRHEPPCTDQPIGIVHEDQDLFVIDKPGGIPVHPAGRFRHNTVIHVLKKERNIPKLFPANRLDLPTSGLMLIAKNPERAKQLEREMSAGLIRKEYLCRVDGEFPEEEITCDAPIKCISHKMSVNYVHDEGKKSTTKFKRLSYNGKTSVVHCKPLTGRTHQIRVHLRYLGYPISNDPLYGNKTTWSPMIRPGEKMTAEDAKLLVDKLFEYSPMEDWGELCLVPTQGKAEVELDETRCSECSCSLVLAKKYDQLCIYLHAWRYASPNWKYETQIPFWAKEDFNEDEAPLKYKVVT
ncbi:hypothetical protein G6F57_005864 [Rhizopus arrhizus]|uniref:Pseudouridine synthase n=1 Tax=Rhizopus oryzae TaxID=64495 RepID=A0A9P7BRV5_RHIOR|nr:hypothetical protein G6F23_008849 [Rhizopus arrhizus]KAG1417988.1 hypothetical protein G6F58_005259 [Rhizopus delemar]KAG0759503.1 hypothetical protein G6F24_009016 [Rhizopus arrhizus]KAG0786305.1 hypothetical protein G6F21_008682 [Rhizopus arrhizus]KAG0787284.1 hypothetical protein G6F22_007367 [Rhizopus arrhizus]